MKLHYCSNLGLQLFSSEIFFLIFIALIERSYLIHIFYVLEEEIK